jgi:hypothetical protein
MEVLRFADSPCYGAATVARCGRSGPDGGRESVGYRFRLGVLMIKKGGSGPKTSNTLGASCQ